MVKRKPTQRQLINLARGREKLFQNQLRKRGIPREIVRNVPISVPGPTKYVPVKTNPLMKINLSLFNSLVETKFFPIEINNNKEILNIKELINYILARLNLHWNKISENKKQIDNVTNHMINKDKENEQKFKKLEGKIFELEKENTELKKRVGNDDANETQTISKV